MSKEYKKKRWFSIFDPEKFQLMLYYSITSFIVIGIVSYLVGEVFTRIEKRGLVERSENYAGYIVNHVNLEMYSDFFFPEMMKFGDIDLLNDKDQFDKFDKVMKGNIYGFNLNKIYLFDMNRQIVYSPVSEHIGYTLEQGKNLQLDSAIEGVPASVLEESGITDSKGKFLEESLLESYYPVYGCSEWAVDKEKQVGVLEIYQNMNDLGVQIKSAHWNAVVITGSSMGLMFLVLLLIIKKASGVIRVKTDQIIEARDNLEEKVEERAMEIKETYERLQETQRRLSRSEKLAGIGTLAAGVAHEINNPLASVASCAEGLISRVDNVDFKTKDDKDVFPDYLKTICDEAYRCKSIISKLLDFSRRREPVFGKVDINGMISDVVRLLRRQKELEQVIIKLNLNIEPVYIYGDVNQLRQIVINMIMNAIDAVVDYGEIIISTSIVGGCALAKFKDTGCGIPVENQGKVLEPFFSTKSPGKGTGLGLSICYGIIEDHNGNISISSDGDGKGTTFTISLPIYIETQNC